MNNKNYRFALLIGLIILFVASLNFQGVQAQEIMQQPTGSIPTVTGTPRGVIATVYLDQDQNPLMSAPAPEHSMILSVYCCPVRMQQSKAALLMAIGC